MAGNPKDFNALESACLDRTNEFFSVADERCRATGRKPAARTVPQKTRFGAAASTLGKALHGLEGRVERLQKLASKSSLFDDPAVEIGDLSTFLRRELSSAAAGLEALASAPRDGGRQFSEHCDAVLASLRAQLKSVTEGFQAALKTRETTISAKESRAAKLSSASAVSSVFAGAGGPVAARPNAAFKSQLLQRELRDKLRARNSLRRTRNGGLAWLHGETIHGRLRHRRCPHGRLDQGLQRGRDRGSPRGGLGFGAVAAGLCSAPLHTAAATR